MNLYKQFRSKTITHENKEYTIFHYRESIENEEATSMLENNRRRDDGIVIIETAPIKARQSKQENH